MGDGTSIREVIEAKWDGTDEYVLSEPVRRELALMEAVVEAATEMCGECFEGNDDCCGFTDCPMRALRPLTTYRRERGYVRRPRTRRRMMPDTLNDRIEAHEAMWLDREGFNDAERSIIGAFCAVAKATLAHGYFACTVCTDAGHEHNCQHAQDLAVAPNGDWVCQDCWDDCAVDAYGAKLDEDGYVVPDWNDLPGLPFIAALYDALGRD